MRADDGDLLPVFAIVWAASIFRVVFALWHGETWETENTLAAMTIVALPMLARDGLAGLFCRNERPDAR